jgi:hypothetical protein
MWCLETLVAINNRPATRASAETRESSAVRSRGGVVVHSAALRSTAFVPAERAARFWRKWQAASPATRHKMADRACLNT